MVFEVINNAAHTSGAGFTQSQFRRLDDLYCRAATVKALTYRTVECDFDEGVASYTYYQSEGRSPTLQFVIRKVGPRDMMYEVFRHGQGRVKKSGVFERAYEHLREEIQSFLGHE